jgi:hypothetical protein
MVEQRRHQTAENFLRLRIARRFLLEQVDEPAQAEQRPVAEVSLGHAVGVEQHRVARLEVDGAHRRGIAAQAERQGRLVGELGDDFAAPQQQRRQVPRTRPFEAPGGEREPTDDASRKRIVAVMIGQRPVDGGVRVRDGGAGSARVPVGADDQARQQRRGDAVAHAVDDREMQEVVAKRIVEGVAGDVVGRLKQPRDDGAAGPAVQRRQQIPLHARRERHTPALPPHVGGVADQRHRRDGQAGEHAEQFHVLQDLSAAVWHRDRQHTGPAGLLRHRHPDADPVVPVGGDRLAGAERPARHRPRDDLAVRAGGKRKQHVAGEVPEVDRGIPGRYRRARGGQHLPEIAAGDLPQDAEGVWVAGNVHGGSLRTRVRTRPRARRPATLSEMSAAKPPVVRMDAGAQGSRMARGRRVIACGVGAGEPRTG